MTHFPRMTDFFDSKICNVFPISQKNVILFVSIPIFVHITLSSDIGPQLTLPAELIDRVRARPANASVPGSVATAVRGAHERNHSTRHDPVNVTSTVSLIFHKSSKKIRIESPRHGTVRKHVKPNQCLFIVYYLGLDG